MNSTKARGSTQPKPGTNGSSCASSQFAKVTELEAASARMEGEAEQLVASRAPLETRRQQLLRCGRALFLGLTMADGTRLAYEQENAAAALIW